MPRQTLIQVRRDSAAEWISVNPTLASGEAGFETDTGKLKFGNGTSAWLDLGYVSGDTNLTNNPVENEYADIAALLADQGNQTTDFFQYVLDASADPNIDSGDAYYEKLAGSTGTLATDYRLLSDTETITITDSNGYRVFRVQYIQDDSSPNTTANGGRIGFNYDTGTDKVTSIVFNSIYSDALDIFYAQRASNTYLIRFYNRNTGVYSFAEVTGWSVSGNYYTVTVANTIDINEISVNNRIELFFDVDNSGGGSTTPTSKTGTTIVFTEEAEYYSATSPLESGNLTLDDTGAVAGVSSLIFIKGYAPTITGDYFLTQGTANTNGTDIYYFYNTLNGIMLNIINLSVLSAPTLVLTTNDEQITADWGISTGATAYELYRNTSNSLSGATLIYDGALRTYTDTGLTNGTTYYYWVKAKDGEPKLDSVYTSAQAVPAARVLVIETTSTSATWGHNGGLVTTGDTLVWTVSGDATPATYTSNNPSIDLSSNVGTAIITVSNVEDVTAMNFVNRAISSFDATYLTSIESLYVRATSGTVMTSIDLSNCTALTDLRLDGNNLSSIDLSSNLDLVTLHLYGNTSLTGVTGLTSLISLQTLYLYNCNISSIDVSTLTALLDFKINTNASLASIDISNNTLLTTFWVYSCGITGTLNVSNNTALTDLRVFSNAGLTTLDITALTALTYLRCDVCAISTLDVSNCTLLTTLWCQQNNQAAGVTDQIYIDLDANGQTNGTLRIRNNRTSASDSANTNLISNGWSITATYST